MVFESTFLKLSDVLRSILGDFSPWEQAEDVRGPMYGQINIFNIQYSRICVQKDDLNLSQEITTFQKDGIARIFVPFSLEHSFEQMKELVQAQYAKLGFDNVVIDKEDSWMIKTSREGQAYVGLSVLNENYKVESYNTQKPDLELYKLKDVEL